MEVMHNHQKKLTSQSFYPSIPSSTNRSHSTGAGVRSSLAFGPAWEEGSHPLPIMILAKHYTCPTKPLDTRHRSTTSACHWRTAIWYLGKYLIQTHCHRFVPSFSESAGTQWQEPVNMCPGSVSWTGGCLFLMEQWWQSPQPTAVQQL